MNTLGYEPPAGQGDLGGKPPKLPLPIPITPRIKTFFALRVAPARVAAATPELPPAAAISGCACETLWQVALCMTTCQPQGTNEFLAHTPRPRAKRTLPRIDQADRLSAAKEAALGDAAADGSLPLLHISRGSGACP